MGMDIKSSGDLFAVSHEKQVDETTFKALDQLILFDEASGINIVETRETDQDEKTGEVEATDIDVLDRSAEGTLTQPKVTPDALAWASAFAFGTSTSTDLTDAYRHRQRLLTYPANPSYFSAAHRRGGASGGAADYRRYIGLGINSFQLTMNKGEFLQMQLGILGIGANDDAVYTEGINALDDAATLVVAGGVKVKDDDFTNITIWCDLDDDGIFEVPVTVISYVNGTDTIGITPPGSGSVLRDYRVSFQQEETGHWSDISALEVPEEFLLKAANIQLVVGAGGITFDPLSNAASGQVALCELNSLVYNLDWQGQVGRCWRTGATPSDDATQVETGDPIQTVQITRDVRDYLFKQHFDANTVLGLYIDALSGVEIATSGEDFEMRMALPRLKFLSKDMLIADNEWAEAGSLVVLKEQGGSDATAEIEVTNAVASYL